jgi:general secretion pathway protein E
MAKANQLIKHAPLLGEILLKHTSLTEAQLEEALKIQKKEGGLLGDLLIRKNFMR